MLDTIARPFEVKLETPNKETMLAIAEFEEMKKNPSTYKGYTDVDQMMDELLS